MRVRSGSALLVASVGLAASKVVAAPVPPGTQIELLPVAGSSFFASSLVASADGANVYAGGTFDVSGFSRDGLSGEITDIDTELVPNATIALSPDDAHLYVAAFDPQTQQADQLAIFARDPEDGLLEAAGTLTPETGGTEALAGIVSLLVSPDGAFLYVVTTSSHGILVFARDAQTGALGTPPLVIDMTVTPTKIVISPDGSYAYVLSNSEEELRTYSRNSETGDLTWLDTLSEFVFTVDDEPSSQLDVAISPDGESVEVTSAPEGTVTVFARDAATGVLSFASELVLGSCALLPRTLLRLATGNSITWVSCFTGRGLQPTSEDRHDVVALARNPENGDLAPIDTLTLIGDLSASNLALGPDEGQVYFAGDPTGVGGARLVPEPSQLALGVGAVAALILQSRLRRMRRAS